MSLEELLKAFSDAGLGEEEIKQALISLKAEIEKYIGGEQAPMETEEQEKERLFGE